MPQSFNNCVKNGGRVRTKTLSQGRYMHICFLNGKSYAGEVKVSKDGGRSAAKAEAAKHIRKMDGKKMH